MLAALMKKELLTLARDVHGMAALFLMPVVFIVVMSMALKDVYAPASRPLAYAVSNRDAGPIAARLVERWAKVDGEARELPENWQDEVRAGHLQYVLLIDPGFSAAAGDMSARAGQAKARLIAEPGMNQALFEARRTRLIATVAQLRAEVMMARLDLGVNVAALVDNTPVAAERLSAGPRPTAVQQNVPAWLVFGMFFVVASIAGLFVEERACGALARLRSLGARPWQLVVGKIMPYLLVNAVQAALMLAVGVWLMPVIGGEGLSLAGVNWAALALMTFSVGLAAVSLALAVASLVRTHGQAATIGPVLNILMAALGGVMVPTFVMPPVMQRIAAYSPMNWGLEGLLDVMLRNGGVAAVLPEAGKLLLFAVLMLLAGFALFRRRA
ncbi:MAG TPA: ABC transporter permease [Rhodocyclaceae bacterium]|nr:ABC transporter permease [Rhodocyclaceae bacterium]